MARVQVNYNGRSEELRTVSAPTIAPVQARFDRNGSAAMQLAEALGATGPLLNTLSKRVNEEEQKRALSYASSLTVEDLNKAIKEEKLLPSQSPIFVATVQHVAGENKIKALQRDVLSKINSGELTFADEAQLDAYLTEERNKTLAGESRYTTAGFDKAWNATRTNILDAHIKYRDKKAQEEALVVASEKMQNRLAEVTAPSFQGTDDDRVGAILKDYQALTDAQVLRGDNRKEILSGIALRLARSGNLELTRKLLKSKLPNNGPMIGAYIGDQTAVSIENIAQAEYDSLIKKREAALKDSLDANAAAGSGAEASAAVAANRGGQLSDVTLPGSGKTLKAEDRAEAAIRQVIAAKPDMPYAEQVRLYANNGVINKDWKREFDTAVNALGEVGLEADNKRIGQVLPATEEALNKFAILRQVSEQYAAKIAGEQNYKILRRIQALRELGTNGDIAQAAAVVNRIERLQIPKATWGAIQQKVTTVMDDLTNPGIFTGRFWGEVFRGEFGNGEKNLLPIRETVRDLSETLLAAGIVSSADEAVKKVGDYLSNPAVVTQINNTLYLNKDLPRVPSGEEANTALWVEAYMREVIGERMKSQGLAFKMSDLTFLPNPGGEGSFMVSLRSQPIPNQDGRGFVTVTRTEMEQWIRSEHDRKRSIIFERPAMALPENYDSMMVAP